MMEQARNPCKRWIMLKLAPHHFSFYQKACGSVEAAADKTTESEFGFTRRATGRTARREPQQKNAER